MFANSAVAMCIDCQRWSAGYLPTALVPSDVQYSPSVEASHVELSFGRVDTLIHIPPRGKGRHLRGGGANNDPGRIFVRAVLNPDYFTELHTFVVDTTEDSDLFPVMVDFAAVLRPFAVLRASTFAPQRMEQVEWKDPELPDNSYFAPSTPPSSIVVRRSATNGTLYPICLYCCSWFLVQTVHVSIMLRNLHDPSRGPRTACIASKPSSDVRRLDVLV